MELLSGKRKELELLAQKLLTKEVLQKADVERLLGPRPYKDEAELLHPELRKDAAPINDEGSSMPATVELLDG